MLVLIPDFVHRKQSSGSATLTLSLATSGGGDNNITAIATEGPLNTRLPENKIFIQKTIEQFMPELI